MLARQAITAGMPMLDKLLTDNRVCFRCGGTLPVEGLATCPYCQTALTGEAAQEPTALASTSPALDVAELMKKALAEQQPGEPIEAAFRRVLPGADRLMERQIGDVVCEYLQAQEFRFGLSRQQAAEQLAQGESQLRIMPNGKPLLETFVMKISGLESVSPDIREQVLEQVKESLAHGKTGPIIINTTKTQQVSPKSLGLAIAAVLVGLIAAYLWGVLR